MSRAVTIMRALAAQHEAVQATCRPDALKLLPPAGEQLMHIRLVAHVEQEVVFRSVEHVVHGDGQFHHAKVGPEMPAGARQNGDQFLADFRRQLFQLGERKSFYIRWRVDCVEYAGHGIATNREYAPPPL